MTMMVVQVKQTWFTTAGCINDTIHSLHKGESLNTGLDFVGANLLLFLFNVNVFDKRTKNKKSLSAILYT